MTPTGVSDFAPGVFERTAARLSTPRHYAQDDIRIFYSSSFGTTTFSGSLIESDDVELSCHVIVATPGDKLSIYPDIKYID